MCTDIKTFFLCIYYIMKTVSFCGQKTTTTMSVLFYCSVDCKEETPSIISFLMVIYCDTTHVKRGEQLLDNLTHPHFRITAVMWTGSVTTSWLQNVYEIMQLFLVIFSDCGRGIQGPAACWRICQTAQSPSCVRELPGAGTRPRHWWALSAYGIMFLQFFVHWIYL